MKAPRTERSADSRLAEALGHFGLLELGGELAEVAGHDAGEVVGGVADAVVGDAALREIVGADLLRAVAGTDLGAAVGAVLFLLLAELHFVKPGPHDLEGALLVLALRAAVLAADVEAGGQVEDLDGGFGPVDVLAARSTGAADFDAEVVGLQLDVDLLGFRHDRDGDGGSVDAALGFGGGDALDAVDAGFVFQGAEYLVAGDAEEDFLEAAHFRRAAGEVLGFPAAGVGVALVKAQQFGGEQRGLVAAGPGADLDDRVAVLIGIGGEQGVLEVLGELRDW